MLNVLFLAIFFVLIDNSAQASVVRVLTYDSMMGANSLGESISKSFEKTCPSCKVEFVGTQDVSGIFQKLKNRPTAYDLVLGLNSDEYRWALESGLIGEGRVFEKSPMAIIVDTKLMPQQSWPKNWKELSDKFSNKIFVQDPRLSVVGVSWLNQLMRTQILEPTQLNKIVSRVFPSWSASYDQFLKGKSWGVWSFLTSEAYHRCQNENAQELRYRALPLEEGYVMHESWVAMIQAAQKKKESQKLFEFLFTDEIQKQIPLKNYMYPGVAKTILPKCFEKLGSSPTEAKLKTEIKGYSDFLIYLDRWSLLK